MKLDSIKIIFFLIMTLFILNSSRVIEGFNSIQNTN